MNNQMSAQRVSRRKQAKQGFLCPRGLSHVWKSGLKKLTRQF